MIIKKILHLLKNKQTGIYDLRISLYLLNWFVGPHGLGARHILPIIAKMANYGIENIRKSIEEEMQNIPLSIEEYQELLQSI